ncbi:MAG TPA: DUF4157 domain-containing protein [Lacibacter sp.]|nr:DUF4157 domain-containing protein [Lacibacter sp.]HMO88098.1 DUF4157 domain-containing protein [Lacibacter sp.]HMP87534.1 DUF4157 domain-containing protein [Lacibacter sp.]
MKNRAFIQIAGPWGGTIRIREQSFLARLAAKKMGVRQVALVLGTTIHLHNTPAQDFLRNRRWLRHELVHVEQYKRLGLLRFLLIYLWYSLRYGYYNNPLEEEARAKEEAPSAWEALQNDEL